MNYSVTVMPSLARYAINDIAIPRVICIIFTLQSLRRWLYFLTHEFPQTWRSVTAHRSKYEQHKSGLWCLEIPLIHLWVYPKPNQPATVHALWFTHIVVKFWNAFEKRLWYHSWNELHISWKVDNVSSHHEITVHICSQNVHWSLFRARWIHPLSFFFP